MGTHITWQFLNERTSVTYQTDILSASINVGRQTYMDVYNGGSLVFTIKNQNSQSAGFAMNDVITVYGNTNKYEVSFWVDEIQYNDYPGNTGLSTATIICSDAITRLGRNLVSNVSLTQSQCTQQATQMNPPYGEFPTVNAYQTGFDSSTASAITYSGAPMTRINQLQNTERGQIRQANKYVLFYSRNYLTAVSTNSVSFGRTGSSSVIGYEEFTRIALGQNFMNNVTVTPTGGAEQIGVNATSITSYGSSYYSLQSEDYTNTQANSLAYWLANAQSDPTALRFEVGFTDRAQSVDAVNAFMVGMPDRFIFDMTYRVPGAGSDTTTQVIMEGYSIEITPSESRFRAYLSPMTLYQFFSLNSPTLGILDTSRLGW